MYAWPMALASLRVRPCAHLMRRQQRAIDVVESCATAKQHRFVQFAPQNLKNVERALFAVEAQAPQNRSTDQDRARTECDCFQHVTASANSTINVNLATIAHRIDNGRQHLASRWRCIQLATAVIRNHNRFRAMLDCTSRVVSTTNSFYHNRQPRHTT